MKTLEQQLAKIFAGKLGNRFGDDFDYAATISPTDLQFGHFASNIAMQLAKKEGKKPLDLAEDIVEMLRSDEALTSVETAGPGFINIRFADEYLQQQIANVLKDFDSYIIAESADWQGKKLVMDYSHPNIGKPMGVHHLLSTIIGDAIKRTYRRVGVEVVADNFIGDLGTQFGKLIHAVKSWGDLEKIDKDPIAELLKLYVQFHIEAENDVELDDAARAEYKKLEDGDPQNRALWQKIVGWSRAEIQPIYDELGVEFDVIHGESFYEKDLAGIIEKGKQLGVFTSSQGALVYQMKEPDLPPAIVQKKDGATLYLTRDLARIAYWEKTWQPDLMMVVVDNAQSFYFKQVFEVAEALQLTDATNLHVGFGRMRFADKSMSTRKGNILLLHELIAEAKKRSRKLVAEKSGSLTDNEQAVLADVLAVGALKYNTLSQNRQSDIQFDWDKMLTFEGNSAPYLLYTVVRAGSIAERAKSTTTAAENASEGPVDAERALMLLIDRLPKAVSEAVSENRPNAIANYLYTLAQHYNNFYNGTDILKAAADDRSRRLRLNEAFVRTMQTGLDMLGLSVPDKM
ncbi:arginine--tRNA ligase [bacterium]|nr:arginine--tRNA ligase [bacterium]